MKKLFAICAALVALSCTVTETLEQQPLENSVVYEMNVRQYTPEGTFSAAQRELPRLAELGVDIVKTNYTGDPDSFREVVEGAIVPVVIAGGPKIDTDEELLVMVKESLEVGGAGVAFGRNLFQAENPGKITRAISEIVHHDLDVDEALEFLK